MSQNIKKKENTRKLNQPTRDVMEFMEKARNKNNLFEKLETEDERLSYIKEDFGL